MTWRCIRRARKKYSCSDLKLRRLILALPLYKEIVSRLMRLAEIAFVIG